MDILLVAKSRRKLVTRRCSPVSALALFAVLLAMAGGAAGWLGYRLGSDGERADYVHEWGAELEEQRRSLDAVRQQAVAETLALTRRLGRLQGHVSRLDALGQRLVDLAQLDKAEFGFDAPPAVGGPESAAGASILLTGEIGEAIDSLERQLLDRDKQLSVLETLISDRQLADEVEPRGRPIQKGWMSSRFGTRNSPFDGRREFHEGVDFAGKLNSPVVAVASGVVTWANARYGYGNLIEINHGNGLATRYGHNKELMVEEGQRVRKGEVIAKMGTSGRSTGPHVHFEVLKNGRAVNPMKYIQAKR